MTFLWQTLNLVRTGDPRDDTMVGRIGGETMTFPLASSLVRAFTLGTMTAALLPPAGALAAPPPGDGWNGRYSHTFDAGRTAGGSAVITTYTLTVTASGCRLSAQGFQIDETIVCTARKRAGSMAIRFRSYADGRTVNRYGVAVYPVGAPLFTLERRGGALVTRWQRYALPDDKARAPGVFFRR